MHYRLEVDLSGLLQAKDALTHQVAPLVGQAVRAVAQEGVLRWQRAVYKARLWGVEKSAYVDSISWRQTGPFSAEIETDYRLAREIELGRAQRDLKASLPTAKRARTVKSGSHAGQKYLIIPFRHNVPTPSGQGALAAQMPPSIYALAKGMRASAMLAPGSRNPATRRSATGHVVPQHSYAWGERLPAGLAPKRSPHHATDIYAGMVRMNTSTGKAKSSAYLTFRVMGEWSSGWIVAPRPGLFLAKGVADDLRGVFDEVIAKAISLGIDRAS